MPHSLTFNIILRSIYVKVKKITDDYSANNGKKNLCGNRIREARLRQRLSQYDLAARLQTQGILIEQDSISRIEIGTRFVADYEVKVLAKVLNVPLEWLLEED